MAKIRKFHPDVSPLGYEHVSGCLRYFFVVLTNLLNWSGFVPFKINRQTGTMEFKLISIPSLFALFRLFIFLSPIFVLNLILMLGGAAEKEYEEVTGRNYTGFAIPVKGLYELFMVEYGISFFIFVLPSAFAFVSAKHMNKMFHCQTDFIRRFVMEEERPQFINKKYVLFPIIGFLFFAVGKSLYLTHVLIRWDQPGLYCFRYINTCFFLLTHLPLHFLLAVFENYLYQNFNMFHVMCSWTLSSKGEYGPLKRAQILPDVMEGIQGGFGFFLLIDLTLMLCFWLLHTYFAYFTFQVEIKIIQFVRVYFDIFLGWPFTYHSFCVDDFGRVLEGLFSFLCKLQVKTLNKVGVQNFEDAYSTYVYHRKFSLLRYTDNAETVIGRLEDEMTPEHAKHDKQAKTNKKMKF